jgi:hypothetical protein
MKERTFAPLPGGGPLRPLAKGRGGCTATDLITVGGLRVGHMRRETPLPHPVWDSGWRFFAGGESPDYLADLGNQAFYDVNVVANFDPDVVPLLDAPVGSAFARDPLSGAFVAVEGDPAAGAVVGRARKRGGRRR